ncbi:transposase [Falsigemmobacter intermedius]|uniref:Transposase n=1 Tax=Falsigemmobacter intermedius TaxID=1553448 RepID=A0A444MBY2_9RHOB|nr:transposase [Falsigemmobacter intermedius]
MPDPYALRLSPGACHVGDGVRVLTVVDIFSRFSPAVDPRFSYRAGNVVDTLERVCTGRGYPAKIRADLGSGFISRNLDLCACTKGVTPDFSPPGKPTDNAFILRRGKQSTGLFPDPSSPSMGASGRSVYPGSASGPSPG